MFAYPIGFLGWKLATKFVQTEEALNFIFQNKKITNKIDLKIKSISFR